MNKKNIPNSTRRLSIDPLELEQDLIWLHGKLHRMTKGSPDFRGCAIVQNAINLISELHNLYVRNEISKAFENVGKE